MRLLSWNARGLGDDDKNDTVCTLLNDARADIICIQETKLHKITVFKAKKFLPSQFTDFLYHPSDGTSAGLLIAWNPKEYKMQIIDSKLHAMTVLAESNRDNTKFTLTNVYAPCDQAERSLFFQEMKEITIDTSIPWVLAGDFNIYRYVNEKINSNINWTAMDEFNTWINDMQLMNVDIANSKYTWSNKRREPTLVKLDRVLINLHWSQRFLHSECRALPRPTSDHKPVLLDTTNTVVQTKKFRYEDYRLNV
jgi:exonuclease III